MLIVLVKSNILPKNFVIYYMASLTPMLDKAALTAREVSFSFKKMSYRHLYSANITRKKKIVDNKCITC